MSLGLNLGLMGGAKLLVRNQVIFDGAADHIDLSGTVPNGSAFEVEVKARVIADLPTNGSDTTNLFYQGTYGSSSGLIQCALRGGSTYKGMLFRIGNGSGGYNQLSPSSDQTSTINDNEFHIFKYTFDGSDSMKLFLDGSEVGSKTSLTSPTFSSTSVKAIMNSVSAEYGVNTAMRHHKVIAGSSVLQEFDFQNNAGTTTVVDISGNGNNGTVTVGSGGLDSFWSLYVG